MATGVLTLCGPAALAHHSPTMFDQTRQLTISGTVRTFQWTNPHCYVQLLVKNGRNEEEWSFEMGSPVYLYNLGWRPSSVKAGATSQSNADSAGLPLLAVVGPGSGTFNLVHTASDRDSTGDAQVTISVRDVPPNTTLTLMRAGDLGRPDGEQADGVCQRAADGLFGPVFGGDGQPINCRRRPGVPVRFTSACPVPLLMARPWTPYIG